MKQKTVLLILIAFLGFSLNHGLFSSTALAQETASRDLLNLKQNPKTGKRIEKYGLEKLEKAEVPLKRIYLFPDSTLCKDLLDFCRRNKIGNQEWVFKGKGRTGQVSATYIWYLLSCPMTPGRGKRREGISVSLGIRKIKRGKLKPAWPHLFRHGAAMNILKRTKSLSVTQRLLGHSTITTTEGYAGLSDEQIKEIVDSS